MAVRYSAVHLVERDHHSQRFGAENGQKGVSHLRKYVFGHPGDHGLLLPQRPDGCVRREPRGSGIRRKCAAHDRGFAGRQLHYPGHFPEHPEQYQVLFAHFGAVAAVFSWEDLPLVEPDHHSGVRPADRQYGVVFPGAAQQTPEAGIRQTDLRRAARSDHGNGIHRTHFFLCDLRPHDFAGHAGQGGCCRDQPVDHPFHLPGPVPDPAGFHRPGHPAAGIRRPPRIDHHSLVYQHSGRGPNCRFSAGHPVVHHHRHQPDHDLRHGQRQTPDLSGRSEGAKQTGGV